MPRQALNQRSSRLLEIEPQYIEKHYMDLAIDKKLVIKEREGEQYIYAAKYYYMEMNTAANWTLIMTCLKSK